MGCQARHRDSKNAWIWCKCAAIIHARGFTLQRDGKIKDTASEWAAMKQAYGCFGCESLGL